MKIRIKSAFKHPVHTRWKSYGQKVLEFWSFPHANQGWWWWPPKKTLLLGVMQNPNSESGLHVYNQRSRVGFASLELSSPNYLFSQFFWNFRKATFYGQWKWRRRRFLFSLVLFIHNGFYHALIPLYCFEDPFHLQIPCIFFTKDLWETD